LEGSSGHGNLVLRNGVALIGNGLEAQSFGSLAVRDGVITHITDEVMAANGMTEVDVRGGFVSPGLIDSHVHFDLAAHPVPYLHWDRSLFIRSRTCFHNGLRALRAGITSIRDLGSSDEMVLDYGKQVNTGQLLGPRVVAAGRPIVMTGGHSWEHGRVANGPDDVRLAVREQLAAGAEVIKFMATGGISTPGNPGLAELTVEELSAGIAEAHRAGVLAAAHAHAPAGITNAIQAGVDTIEHAAFADLNTHALMVEAGITLVPTVTALSPIAEGMGIPKDTVVKSLQARETFQKNTGGAIAAGVTIAAGTDAGTALNPIGGLLDELLLYVQRGMSEAEALRSATVTAGRLVRRAGENAEVGVIAVGARADLIITPSNPRSDLQVLRRPAGVIVGGRPVDLDWIDQTLAETEPVLANAE
jgi:imidazolonepropionase-like amidohydrolase